MKVTVVIPCYNRSMDIEGAIKTVLQQTYANWEIIVVDDGSQDIDATSLIVRNFACDRIKLLKLCENRGQTTATNYGMFAAEGECIALLDSDDRWHKRKLELQVQEFLRHNDVLTVIYPQSIIITNRHGIIKKTIMPKISIGPREALTDYLFCHRGFMQSSGLFFSKKLLSTVKMREDLKRHTDYDFVIGMQKNGCRFIMIPIPLVTVNWIDVHLRKANRDMGPSFDFIGFNKNAFSDSAKTQFVLKQILLPLVCARSRPSQIRRAISEISIQYLGLAGFIALISCLLFKDDRLLNLSVQVKNFIQRKQYKASHLENTCL